MAEYGGVLCSKHGYYGVRDTGRGFYEVWYECGRRELDEWVSDHETEYSAMIEAKCCAHADEVLAKKRAKVVSGENINRFMGSANVYDSVVGKF